MSRDFELLAFAFAWGFIFGGLAGKWAQRMDDKYMIKMTRHFPRHLLDYFEEVQSE
jgi:hypothetical protein